MLQNRKTALRGRSRLPCRVRIWCRRRCLYGDCANKWWKVWWPRWWTDWSY